jgi:hypothetical protein
MINNFSVTTLLSLDRCVVRQPFTDFFPSREFNSYEAFVSAPGKCLKSEPRTQVVILERLGKALNGKTERFVLKEYYYPILPSFRTWARQSKAEHEFRSLQYVQSLGIGAAEAVAFGARRTLLGFVRSCFIVTHYVENSFTLEDWIKGGDEFTKTSIERDWPFYEALGKTFRIFHQERFFLFTAKPKNILLRRTDSIPEIVIIDIPYALRLTNRFLARRAQALDLAVFLGNIERIASEEQRAIFYNSYLPDPLGAPSETLERRLADAIRWRRNQTPVSWLVHSVRRAGKKWPRKKTDDQRALDST